MNKSSNNIIGRRTSPRLVAVAFGTAVAFASTSALANPCESQWMKLTASFKALVPLAKDLVCAAMDGAAAGASAGASEFVPFETQSACQEQYEDVVKQIDEWIKTYNAAATGTSHIGPRECAPGFVYDGNVKAERVFVCSPVVGKRWHVDFEILGGKAKKTLQVDVCLLDPETLQAVRYERQTFDGAKDNVGETLDKDTYGKATGLIPMVYLHKPIGLNGYEYRIDFDESGTPDVAKGPPQIGSSTPVTQTGPTIDRTLDRIIR